MQNDSVVLTVCVQFRSAYRHNNKVVTFLTECHLVLLHVAYGVHK